MKIFSWNLWGGGAEILTPVLINSGRCLKLNTVPPRHQREPLLRLSLEFITSVQPVRPDDQLEVRTSIEEALKQSVNLGPISLKDWRRLSELGGGFAQFEHEFGESGRHGGRKIVPERCHRQSGRGEK